MSIIAVALLAVLNGAPAQDEASRVETRSDIRIVTTDGQGPGRLDVDGDGVVTREEFSAPMGSAFDRLDADRDGRLSTEEMAESRGGPGDRLVLRDGPGGPGGPGVHIFTSRIDGAGGRGGPGEGDVRIVSRDGGPGVMMLDGRRGAGGNAEVFLIHRDGPEGGPAGRPGGGPGQNQVFVRRFGGPDGPGEMDKDADGKVSQAEFLAPMIDAFTRMDADGDGFLDDGEGAPPPPPPAD